jgi:RNA polymerase sigma factor (sigma-70 family)
LEEALDHLRVDRFTVHDFLLVGYLGPTRPVVTYDGTSLWEVNNMTGSVPEEAVAEAFVEQRGRLVAVAYRMLGSREDAEDAVQEAWLRLARQDAATIVNLAGWLNTVVGRVCIDMLRSRKTRPDVSYEDRLPELEVARDDGGGPEDEAVLAESVGLALLVVLDTLRPAERLAFVLHDMFSVPFEEIGQIIGRSTDASKMLASRARRKVQGTHRSTDDPQQQRAVVDAFLAAARDGDFEGLLRVLDPDVMWRTHTAHGVVVKLGATEVAIAAQRGARAKATAQRVLVNGEPGIVAWGEKGKPLGVMACTVVDGRIVELLSVTDPKRLAAMDLPGRPV